MAKQPCSDEGMSADQDHVTACLRPRRRPAGAPRPACEAPSLALLEGSGAPAKLCSRVDFCWRTTGSILLISRSRSLGSGSSMGR